MIKDNSLLLVDKPLHYTSFDVIRYLRHQSKCKKMGHAGTLDPLATGLLIICTGHMTKQIPTFMEWDKTYNMEITLGAVTASYDLETPPMQPKAYSHLHPSTIHQVIMQFQGEHMQTPPVFSAIKQQGRRLYAMARAGETPTLPPRLVHIRSIEICAWDLPRITLTVCCSKGTYMRSLAQDIGAALGCGAYVSALQRTHIGAYKVSEALPISFPPKRGGFP